MEDNENLFTEIICDNDGEFTCGFSCCVLQQQDSVMAIWKKSGNGDSHRDNNVPPLNNITSISDLNHELRVLTVIEGDSLDEYICGVKTNNRASTVCSQHLTNGFKNCTLECVLKSTACPEYHVSTQ